MSELLSLSTASVAVAPSHSWPAPTLHCQCRRGVSLSDAASADPGRRPAPGQRNCVPSVEELSAAASARRWREAFPRCATLLPLALRRLFLGRLPCDGAPLSGCHDDVVVRGCGGGDGVEEFRLAPAK